MCKMVSKSFCRTFLASVLSVFHACVAALLSTTSTFIVGLMSM